MNDSYGGFFCTAARKTGNCRPRNLRIVFQEMLADLFISLFFLNISDKMLEKIFAFSTAFARTGYIHDLL